jgi:hypothetical protein
MSEGLMPAAADPALSIRAALNRKALADTRHRAALARRLQLAENEVLAVQHLARTGELTPGQLGTQLQPLVRRNHRGDPSPPASGTHHP